MSDFFRLPLPIGLLTTGIACLALGFSHRIPGISKLDTNIFKRLHVNLRSNKEFFRYIWPLGTTPVSLVMIAMTFAQDWKSGITTILPYTLIASIEWMMKKNLQRPRPFVNLQGISMSQPSIPKDSSFPSGDAMRIWFLAITIPAIFNMACPVWILTSGIAVILSLGRIALGVHYPLDIISGMGLGFIGASLNLLTSKLFVYIYI